MKTAMTYSEWEREHKKRVYKAIKDTITGGFIQCIKYLGLALMFGGLPIWMILDYLSKGCY